MDGREIVVALVLLELLGKIQNAYPSGCLFNYFKSGNLLGLGVQVMAVSKRPAEILPTISGMGNLRSVTLRSAALSAFQISENIIISDWQLTIFIKDSVKIKKQQISTNNSTKKSIYWESNIILLPSVDEQLLRPVHHDHTRLTPKGNQLYGNYIPITHSIDRSFS